ASFQNQSGAVTGGTLKLDNSTGDLVVRQINSATGTHLATLDLSKLSNFIANVRNLSIGVGDASGTTRAEGTLWLADHSTINAASSMRIGDVLAGGGSTQKCQLFMG